MTAAEKELEEYTITDSAETSVFFDHTMTVMKKKILVQVRDKKTLGIDTVFPVLLIVAGLALSTVAVIKDGQSREMNPVAIYPQPLDILNNQDSVYCNPTTGKITTIPTFIDENIIAPNGDGYSWASNYTINFASGVADILN